MSSVAAAMGGTAYGQSTTSAIRPFQFHAPEAQLSELKRRIKTTRWPERETVADDSQGIPLATMQALAQYWAGAYDWRKCENRLNAYPQFVTGIDGLDIHFMHIRSKHANAMPLIVTHGWPGSVLEQLKIIDLLTNPTAHDASPSDAFHLVIPSLPGYGFSAKPGKTGWGPERTALAWVVLMKRLGYDRFAAQGGDLGSVVSQAMAVQAPPELIGIHINFPSAVPPQILMAAQNGDPAPAGLDEEEKRAYASLSIQFKKRRAYSAFMATRPQTLYGLADSPVGLASYLLDHGDGWGQPAATITSALAGHDVGGYSAGTLTRDDLLDGITLYWLTNTGVSAARFYWESHTNLYLAPGIKTPVAVSAFPGEIYQVPRRWAETAYPNLIYYGHPDKGGHFAAWEQPELFSEEVRAGLRPLRRSSS
ncbi:epoxide hydrolase family protein [Pseudoduganella sp. UC29_106]|uniref:epoxide hydrolase family protein n=1 Tax=Pseudoduganella sp. UC29_106 TaxID=3374553 RepID=UPI003757F095